MTTGLKQPLRALKLHTQMAAPYYLVFYRGHREPYVRRAYEAAGDSFNVIGKMLAQETDPRVDVKAIKAVSDAYRNKWLTNPSLSPEFREAVEKHVKNLDALATAVGGGWSERMFPMFADNDK